MPCHFSSEWLRNPAYSTWLKQTNDSSKASCKLCVRSFDVGNMGEAALRSHMKGTKHSLYAKTAAGTGTVMAYCKNTTDHSTTGGKQGGVSVVVSTPVTLKA